MRESFIEAVSSFNKELFHSRAIAHLLNNDENFRELLLNKIGIPILNYSPITFHAFTEVLRTDILCVVQNDSKFHFIHIENKIKATESVVPTDKYTKIKDTLILSQTEYYFHRLKDDKFKKKFQKKSAELYFNSVVGNKEKSLETNFEEDFSKLARWSFIFLKPICLRSEDVHINQWRSSLLSCDNPWKNFTYESLIIDCLQKSFSKRKGNRYVSEHDYLKLIEKDFKPSVYTFQDNFLSITISRLAFSNKLNTADYNTLVLLYSKTKDYLTLISKNQFGNKFVTQFSTDSGNSRGIIVEFHCLIENVIYDSVTKSRVHARLGFQHEQNCTGSKMKLFFAAQNYDAVKPIERKAYNSAVLSFLSESNFSRSHKILSTLNETGDCNFKYNGSKTRSFCSVASDFDTFNSVFEYQHIFKNLMEQFFIDVVNLKQDKLDELSHHS